MPIHSEMIIGGAERPASTGRRYDVCNPADGELVGTAPLASHDDAACAVGAAQRALDCWAAQPVDTRAAFLDTALDAVEARQDELARLLTSEQGKPVTEARAEIAGFVSRMRSFARLARKTPDGRVPALPSMSERHYGDLAAPEPTVTVGLVAWNFPVGLMAKKLGPMLVAGGTAVIKPAFTTPLTALRVIALMNEAGLPPGVLNCVTGCGEDVGALLASSPGVGRVHLTGSDETGRQLAHAIRANGPALLLELAGSDPMIVCADADVSKAVRGAVTGRFRNAGQMCMAVKRLYVASEIYDTFVDELVSLVAQFEPGDGAMPSEAPRVRIGPLHTSAVRARVEEQLDDAVREGADVLIGGGRPASRALDNGFFLEPTIVANVPSGSRLVNEEVFGPVLPVFRTHTMDDAIEQANRSPFRLSASIWTSDYAAARRAAPAVQCRQLWINRLPFGTDQVS